MTNSASLDTATRRLARLAPAACIAACLLPSCAFAQSAFTWQQIKEKFASSNPALLAAQADIEESRAAETTAFLRPNPEVSLTMDGFQVTPGQGVWRPLSGIVQTPGISYLHERRHKRELRLEGAKISTDIASSQYLDQQRGLLFNLRNAFIQTLQAKAVLQNARENLDYWDRELDVDRTRFKAGDMALTDLNRMELQRVQFESDLETATVNLRTAKIQLLTLLNDRTPIEKFDVAGPYDFQDQLLSMERLRSLALESRPDLKAAAQLVDLAESTHRLAIANGSTDPTFSLWYSHNPSFSNPYASETMGGSISIPLRIFDRNQGEKARTEIDIRRNQRLRDAAQAQVYGDVDSAYVTVAGALNMLRPYKNKYMPLALDVRDRIAFAYKNGGASLLDYLDAEKSYRDTKQAYLNLIGAYLTAAAQMNMAVGKEVL
ncbi:MAG: TolC family protein [Acidobacteria bacterium]|nr:TolC family protein [Acidobacteriota bacterium]